MKCITFKKIIALSLGFLVITGFCFAADTDPVEGYWISTDQRTGNHNAGWHIYQIEGTLYGVMVSTTNKEANAENTRESYPGFPIPGRVNQMPILGTPWIFGLTRESAGVWLGGHIIHPKVGRMFRCKIIFHPPDGRRYLTDTLEVRGEIGLGIGRSEFLQRTDRRTAESL
jgi:uncharacterized protein (DUF2147 family)